jgi:hypothetical protein
MKHRLGKFLGTAPGFCSFIILIIPIKIWEEIDYWKWRKSQ